MSDADDRPSEAQGTVRGQRWWLTGPVVGLIVCAGGLTWLVDAVGDAREAAR